MSRAITDTVDGAVIDARAVGSAVEAEIHSGHMVKRGEGSSLPDWWIQLRGVAGVGWTGATIGIGTVYGGVAAEIEAQTPRLEPDVLDVWAALSACALALRADDAETLPSGERIADLLERAAREAASASEGGAP